MSWVLTSIALHLEFRIGNAAGFVVGVVVGVCNLYEWGEPSKSVTEHVSGWIEDTINDVGNWFARVFW